MAEMNLDGVSVSAVTSVPADINLDGVSVSAVTRIAGLTQFKRTAKVELLEAISAGTGVPLDPTKYDIGPVVNEDPPTAKATIDLIALESSGKRRSTPLVYRRRPVGELGAVLDMDLMKPSTAKPINDLPTMVEALNSIFGLTLTVADFLPVSVVQGGDTVLTTAPESHYFVPGGAFNVGRMDGVDREFELLNRGLVWPAKTILAQQGFFVKDTFRTEFNKLFGDTWTAPQATIPDVSEPKAGPTTNRDRQITMSFDKGQGPVSKTVYYFQLPLKDLAAQLQSQTVWDLRAGKILDAFNVSELSTISGLPLDANEFVNTDLVETTPGGAIDVIFKATPNSKFFKGEVVLAIQRAPLVTTIVPNGTHFEL